jgi:iron complex outermembrane recepter protein
LNVQNRPFIGKPLPLVLALSLVYASPFVGVSANAQVQTSASATANYEIEAGPLDQALRRIESESGRALAFDPARVRSRVSAPVKGALTAEAAVRAALVGTGLTVGVKPDGTLLVSDAVVPAPAEQEQALPVTALEAITVVAQRDQAETSFKVDRTSTSTRSDTDLMDVPSSVTVITSKVLESQQATSVKDAISQVAGVIYTQSPQGAPSFSIRGFGQTSVLSNGLQSNAASGANVFGVERIEVLKGPQAILSGSGSLGGAVNIVIKKPQAEPIRELTTQYASHDDMLAAIDLSGAVSQDKRLTYRFIASREEQSKNAAGFDGNKAEYYMPELRWKDSTTDVIVGYSADNSHSGPPAYTFAYLDYVQPMPKQRLGHESDGFDNQTQNYFYTWTQKIRPGIQFTSKMQHTDNKFALRMKSPLGMAGTDTVFFAQSHQETQTQTTAGDHYFESNFNTGPVTHKITTGISHDKTSTSMLELYEDGMPVAVYGDPYDFTASKGTPYSLNVNDGQQVGGYALDLMKWGDVSILLGARRSKYQAESSVRSLSSGQLSTTPSESIWETSPMVGVVYSVTPTVSVYANYVDGFNPQLGKTMCGGVPNEPMRTKNKEAGAKFDFFGSKFSVTTAMFELDQSNVMSYNSAQQCYNLISAQTTKGIELDMAGQVYEGLNLLFNATYTKLKDASGETLVFAAHPTQRASLWATYEFQSEALRGWGMGLGIAANNKSYLGAKYATSTTDPVKLPGSARIDASVSYRRKDWSLLLGVKNVFDRELYDFATTTTYVPVQPSRTTTLTYKVNF